MVPVLLGALVVLLGAGWLVASPYLAVRSVREALREARIDDLEGLVDWRAVRSDVKAETATLLRSMTGREARSDEDRVIAALVSAFGEAAAAALIDKLVTAEQLTSIWAGRPLDFSEFGLLGNGLMAGLQRMATEEWPADWQARLAARLHSSSHYVDWDRFDVRFTTTVNELQERLPIGHITLSRRGLSWVVTDVAFAADLRALADRLRAIPRPQSPSFTAPAVIPDTAAAPDSALATGLLNSAVDGWTAQGYQLHGERFEGVLGNGTSRFFDLALPVGDYVVTARCDAGCSDIDLKLEDASSPMAPAQRDVEADDSPLLTVRVLQSTTYRLTVDMVDCSTPSCAFTTAVVAKPLTATIDTTSWVGERVNEDCKAANVGECRQSLTIDPRAPGLLLQIGTSGWQANTCAGGLSGPLTVNGQTGLLTVGYLDEECNLSLTLNPDGSVTVSEDFGCRFHHGTSCSFDGVYALRAR